MEETIGSTNANSHKRLNSFSDYGKLDRTLYPAERKRFLTFSERNTCERVRNFTKTKRGIKIVETFFDSPHQVLCLMWKLMDKEEKFLHYLYFHTQVKIASKRIQLAGNGSELYCMESRELGNRVFLNN